MGDFENDNVDNIKPFFTEKWHISNEGGPRHLQFFPCGGVWVEEKGEQQGKCALPPIDQFLVALGWDCARNMIRSSSYFQTTCSLNTSPTNDHSLIHSPTLKDLTNSDQLEPISFIPFLLLSLCQFSELRRRFCRKISCTLLLEVCGGRSVQVEIISKRKENT